MLENHFWVALTNFGDSALLLPMAFILVFLLWGIESFKAAFLLCRALLLCIISLFLLKLAFISCAKTWGTLDWGVHSPSGHTGLSLMVYGSLATVLMKQVPAEAKMFIAYAALALVGMIAYSRVLLGAHSWAEVMIGATVSTLALLTFALPYSRLKHPQFNLLTFFSVLALGVVLTYGLHAPAEPAVREASNYLRWKFNFCR